MAKLCLEEHSCEILKFSGLTIKDTNSLENIEENKENDSSHPQSNRKRLSSPSKNAVMVDDIDQAKNARKVPKRRKIKTSNSPMIFKTDSPVILGERQQKAKAVCECALSRILLFQLNLYKSLCEYAKLRSKTLTAIKELVDCRMKLKDSTNILTNADNLHLQTPSTQTLISPELCDEFSPNLDDEQMIKGLDSCLEILENLKEKELLDVDQTLEKQFYDSIDLLAHFFGFLGLVLNRTTCLEIKLSILDKNLQSSVDTIYSNTIINLMKSYLNSNQLDNFEFLFEKLNLKKIDCAKKTQIKTSDMELDTLYEKNQYLSNKSEFQISYYLNIMHYFILKGKVMLIMYFFFFLIDFRQKRQLK